MQQLETSYEPACTDTRGGSSTCGHAVAVQRPRRVARHRCRSVAREKCREVRGEELQVTMLPRVSAQVPHVTAAWRCVHVPTQDCRHVPVRVAVDVPEEKCRQVREQFVKTRVPSSC